MGSWNTLVFSADPEYRAPAEVVEWLTGLGEELAHKFGFTHVREVKIHAHESPAFVWAGMDMAVVCPECGAEDPDQWGERMNEALSENGALDPIFTCTCGAEMPVSHLAYQGCAFRPFIIELTDARLILDGPPPGENGWMRSQVGISEDEPFLKELGRILGTELIWTLGKM